LFTVIDADEISMSAKRHKRVVTKYIRDPEYFRAGPQKLPCDRCRPFCPTNNIKELEE